MSKVESLLMRYDGPICSVTTDAVRTTGDKDAKRLGGVIAYRSDARDLLSEMAKTAAALDFERGDAGRRKADEGSELSGSHRVAGVISDFILSNYQIEKGE